MRAPRIEMAQLIPVAGKGAQSSPVGDPFVVPFNPTTLKVTYTNSLSDESGQGAQQKAGKQSSEFAVELIFDTTDTSASSIDWGDATAKGQVRAGGDIDVRIFTKRIIEMMQPSPAANNQKDASAPPSVRFIWGSFLFEGVLKSLTETLELFSAQGIPLRATLSLSLTQDQLEFKKAPNSSGGGSSLFTPLSGASAAGAMVSLGLDPLAGKLMAAMNGLDDLRKLPSGVALSLPDVSLGASAAGSLGASASGAFGASASAGASASFSMGAAAAAAAGGYGDGRGISITLGGGGNFGLDAGASIGAGVGVSAGLAVGIGISGSLGFGAGLGVGASSGLNINVTGGISGGSQEGGALPGSGAVGGPRNGSTPGAQVVMAAGGRMALAPAAPRAPLVPSSSAPAVATQRTLAAPPPSQGSGTSAGSGTAQGSTRVSGSVGVSARVAASSAGLPPPLPPQSTGTARGAFEGIYGVPMKRARFSVGVPPLRPLAYRRMADADAAAAEALAQGSGQAGTAASVSTNTCGCAKSPGTQSKGARCACQH